MQCLSYDTETTGLNPYGPAKMFAYSTCDEDGGTRVLRLDGKDRKLKTGKSFLEKIWRDKKLFKVMHNAKFDLAMTEKRLGRKLAEDHPFHDTIIQSALLQNDHRDHKLKHVAWELAGIPMDDEAAIRPYTLGEFEDYSSVPVHLMHDYQLRDAERTMLLHLFFYPKILADPGILDTYNTEIELVTTTLRIEGRGVMVHRSQCLKLMNRLKHDCEQVLQECKATMGRRINLRNDNHVRKLLYYELDLPRLKKTPKGNAVSVNKDTLALLRVASPHPVLEMILKYRSWMRGITILESYLDLCDENDIVHPNLRTCGARSGRESCSKPNLQNVAKEEVLLNPYPIAARKAFRPRPGFVNLHFDYKGIQFKLAIHFTGDENLFNLVWTGKDLHVVGAEILCGDRWFKATDHQKKILRSACKNANFAKMFGAGSQKIGETLGFKVDVSTIRQYNEIFGSLDTSFKRFTKEAKETGFTQTLLGRKLRIPTSKAYVATNYAIQGSEADVLKRAQNRVHEYLERVTGGEAGLILPIHDELVVEYPRSRLSEAPQIVYDITQLMSDFPTVKIPLDVDVEITTTDWAHKKEYTQWKRLRSTKTSSTRFAGYAVSRKDGSPVSF